jgi:transposase
MSYYERFLMDVTDMLTITNRHKIYIACQSVDFRKGIDGYAAVCRRQFNLNPLSGHCFIFRNRRHTAIKVLLYDGTGFWLCHKRLSKGRFKQWPSSRSDVVTIDADQLSCLLQH